MQSVYAALSEGMRMMDPNVTHCAQIGAQHASSILDCSDGRVDAVAPLLLRLSVESVLSIRERLSSAPISKKELKQQIARMMCGRLGKNVRNTMTKNLIEDVPEEGMHEKGNFGPLVLEWRSWKAGVMTESNAFHFQPSQSENSISSEAESSTSSSARSHEVMQTSTSGAPGHTSLGSLSFDAKIGKAVGTSYREVEGPLQRQLFNAYCNTCTSVHGSLRAVCRHAVPDTKERMHMLLSMVNAVHSNCQRLRCTSLLTRSGNKDEEAMWLRQDHFVRTIFAEQGIRPAWISLQANANTKFNWLNGGEQLNKAANIQGVFTYGHWVFEDFKLLTKELRWIPPSDGDKKCFRSLEELINYCEMYPFDPEAYQKKALGFFMKGRIFEPSRQPFMFVVAWLKHLRWIEMTLVKIRMQNKIEGVMSNRIMYLELAAKLLSVFINSQYAEFLPTNPDMCSRVQELLILAMLDQLLGCSSTVNCKSGCDRAGMVHAATMAVDTLVRCHGNSIADVVGAIIHFDTIRTEIDSCAMTFGEYKDFLSTCLHNVASSDKADTHSTRLLLVCELRNLVLMQMMQIGWKINVYSTGVPGMKYHVSADGIRGRLQANPHIGAALPPFALVPSNSAVGTSEDQGASIEYTPLAIQQHGQMTALFSEFIHGCSSFRGS